MTTRAEQDRARAYLLERGTRAPVSRIRPRVADAFAAMDGLLEGVAEAQARRAPGPGEWSVQEVVDHLVETHPLALREMRALLENRHSPVSPIPAGLQSAAPLARPWQELRARLREIHREVLDALAAAPDVPTDARAPVNMVITTDGPDGARQTLHWVEDCDWKACAVLFRLHELDHLGQIKRLLRPPAA
jgi:hypothetical protein